MSPLPMTGISTACLTARMMLRSMPGIYICARVRAWTVMRAAPACWQALAHSTAVTCSSSQPLRILTVTGREVWALTWATISPHSSGWSISLLPAPPETILGAGQPILISRKSKSSPSIMAAAWPMISGTSPNSCTP